MAPNRYYSSTAAATTLSSGCTSSATSISVAATTGFPSSTPYTLVLDEGSSSEEIVTVSAVSGTTLTVVRGEDGSAAVSHLAGAVVRHMMTARDLREPQEHLGSTAGHGVSGAVVGTTDTQTLTNKTLSGASNTFTNIPASAVPGVLALSTVTTKGDLIAATGSGAVTRVGVGADGAVLTASSAAAGGVAWVAPTASGAWTAYTPTLTNVTSGAAVGAYRIDGKTLYFRITFTAGTSVSSTSYPQMSLPAGYTSAAYNQGVSFGPFTNIPGSDVWANVPASSTAVNLRTGNTTALNSANLTNWAVTGVIEVV